MKLYTFEFFEHKLGILSQTIFMEGNKQLKCSCLFSSLPRCLRMVIQVLCCVYCDLPFIYNF